MTPEQEKALALAMARMRAAKAKDEKKASQSPVFKAGLAELSDMSTGKATTNSIVDAAKTAFASGNDEEGKRLLTEANRLAVSTGAAPDGFVANPETGGMMDLRNDPSLDMGQGKSAAFGAMQGLGFNFGDEAIGLATAAMGGDRQFAEERAREMDRRAQENTLSYLGGYIPGAIASSLTAGKALGIGNEATMGGRMAASALLGGGQSALAGAGAGEGEGRARGALIGGLIGAGLGAAAPPVASGLGKLWEAFKTPAALKAAAAGAQTTDELRAAGNAAYQAIDDAGVVVKPEAFADATGKITGDMAANGLRMTTGRQQLTPKAADLAEVMYDMATDPAYSKGVPFSEIDVLRKIAGAPASDMANNLDRSLGVRAIEGIDDFVNNLTPDQVASGNAENLPEMVKTARSLWSKMLKSGLIDDAIEKSKNYQSGEASGLANRFRTILNSDKLSRGFTDAEKAAMRRVINGTLPERFLRFMGGGIGNVVSGATGYNAGGIVGLLGGTAISGGARKAAEVIANRNAELVRALIANGGKANLPVVPGTTKAALSAMIRGGAQYPTAQ